MSETVRLHVYLAHSGVASRRASEGLITAGRVAVNGAVVTELGTKVGEGDRVAVDGIEVKPETLYHYIALNKPPGYLCSSRDEEGKNRPLAADLLPAGIRERLYTVGRLDFLSSGLVLFTNDGSFAARLSHPSAEIEKEYLVEATAPIPDDLLAAFREGVVIDDVRYQCKVVTRAAENRAGGNAVLSKKTISVILVEGKNREIRRVFSAFHLHPRLLRRVRIGPVRLGSLREGETRDLTGEELRSLGQ